MNLAFSAKLQRRNFTFDVNLRIDRAVTGIFGPSGAGKTTLLHIIAGLVQPDAGRVTLGGEIFFDSASRTFLPPHRRRLGIVFQDGRLFPHLSVRANLLYGHDKIPAESRRFGLEEVVNLLEITHLLERWPAQLSGGESQRVALGRAILCSPRLLLFDEPMASLDRRLRRQITPFFQRIRDATQIPILYVSHDPRDILDLTDQFAVLDQGRLLGHGALLDLVENPRILQLMEEDGLTNMLPLTVARHAPEDGITHLTLRCATSSSGAPITISGPLLRAPVGADVQAGLSPEDVVLATGPITGASIQNQIPGRIIRLAATPTREICIVDVGVPIIAEITRPARQRLKLEVGSTAWCLFKTCTLHYRNEPPPDAENVASPVV
jgi:molybdate transport system ATP-binding protein